jgi:hypothetical protein
MISKSAKKDGTLLVHQSVWPENAYKKLSLSMCKAFHRFVNVMLESFILSRKWFILSIPKIRSYSISDFSAEVICRR